MYDDDDGLVDVAGGLALVRTTQVGMNQLCHDVGPTSLSYIPTCRARGYFLHIHLPIDTPISATRYITSSTNQYTTNQHTTNQQEWIKPRRPSRT